MGYGAVLAAYIHEYSCEVCPYCIYHVYKLMNGIKHLGHKTRFANLCQNNRYYVWYVALEPWGSNCFQKCTWQMPVVYISNSILCLYQQYCYLLVREIVHVVFIFLYNYYTHILTEWHYQGYQEICEDQAWHLQYETPSHIQYSHSDSHICI